MRNEVRQALAQLLLVACFFACAGFIVAQEKTGQVSGTVLDDTGAAIPGARITASTPGLPRELETSSDADGSYVFPSLPPGPYTFTVSKTGFATVKQHNIQVSLGSKIIFNPKLTVGTVTQTIEVTESSLSLDVTSSRASTNITPDTMATLPKSRNFNSLLSLAPGVRLEAKSGTAGVGGISVDGASGSENVFIIDGVEVSDTLTGALRGAFNVPFEFLSEIQVKSGGFEAEYGGATGGVVNLATRSGSNEFHGEVNFQFTSNQLNPRPRGTWQGSPLNADLADFYAAKEDTYRKLYPGFTLGGPILKNRVYFFAGYMPEFARTERSIAYASGTREYFQETIQHFGLGKLDYAATSKLNIATSWIWSPYRVKGGLPNSDPRRAVLASDQSVLGGFQPTQGYTASANYTATPTFLISARYGYKYLNDKSTNYGIGGLPYITNQTATSASPVPVPPQFQGPTGANTSSTLLTARDVTTRKNLYLDATKMFNMKGQHSFKFGYALNQQANDVATDYTNGRFLIYWGDKFSRGSVNNATGTYGYYTWEDGVRLNSNVSGRNQGFYLQDSWRIHSRVTLNLGIRLENEFLPPYKKEQGGVKIANPVVFGWGEKIAPRLGFAWDIRGDGKWKLSGGYLTAFDVMKFNLARGSFGGEFWITHVYTLDNPATPTLSKASPGALGKEIISYDNRTIPINSAGVIEGNDPDLKPYQTREFSFNLDHQLSSKMVAGIRYTRKRLVNSIDDIGVLDAEDNEVYLIGNAGRGLTRDTNSVYGQKTPNGKEFLVPQATRDYDAVEFSVRGRPTAHLQLQTSYTYSRDYGNYSGLANSDENGRSNPNNDRAFDLPFYYFDSTGSQKNVFGRLATDRPHTFKLFGGYDLKTRVGQTFFGLTQNAWSGTPLSTSVIYQSAPTYPFGRGDLGRTPVFTQTDAQISHSIKLSERTNLRVEANAINLLNQAAVMNTSQQINRSGAITAALLPVNKFFAGYKLSDFVNPQNLLATGGVAGAKYNPVFRLPTSYQSPREFRVGVRLTF
jgi:hypothetical protein